MPVNTINHVESPGTLPVPRDASLPSTRLEHRTVPRDHLTMPRPPRLAALAASIRDGLAQTWEPR